MRILKNKLTVIILAVALVFSIFTVYPFAVGSESANAEETAGATESAGTESTGDASENTAAVTVAEGEVSASESAGAPPATFDVYVEVGDYDSTLLATYTGTQMRKWAAAGNPGGTLLKYSAQSYSGTAGRVVKEYITLEDFTSYVSEDIGGLSFESGDYFIMGEDLTRDQDYLDDGYTVDQLMGNWYSYDSMIGTTRYYFPNWDSASEEGATEVPAVIGIKSYGASSGMSDAMLDIYATSMDYLWAYVVYYGQQRYSENNYSYFYYGQTQAIYRYEEDSPVNETVNVLLTDALADAEVLLADTVVGTSASDVAEGTCWVTEEQYNVMESAVNAARSAAADEDVTNGEAYAAYLTLDDAADTFESQRTPGEKSGYFWYTDNTADTYVITSANQLFELCEIVNGEAYDRTSGEMIEQDSFEGKTFLLEADLDAEQLRPHIGNSEFAFEGTFDGQGYTIRNLHISFSSNAYSYLGLFGNLGESGTVRNLNIEGDLNVGKASKYIGGLVGYNAGTVENCTSDLTVKASLSSCVGGLVGCNAGTITDCASTGAVVGGTIAGGFAGQNEGTLTGCVNVGIPTGGSCLGGIAAVNGSLGIIDSCIDTVLNLVSENSGTLSCSYTIGGYAADSSDGSISNVFCVGTDAGLSGVTVLDTPVDFQAQSTAEALNAGDGTNFVSLSGGYPALSWQQVYTVYFDLGFENHTAETAETAEYLPTVRPDDPSVSADGTEYVFDAWYADADLTIRFDFSDGVIDADTVVYAGWTDADGIPCGY